MREHPRRCDLADEFCKEYSSHLRMKMVKLDIASWNVPARPAQRYC